MKKEDLYESIAQLDDDLLLRSEMRESNKPIFRFNKWAAAAACFCIIAAAGIGVFAFRQNAGQGMGNPNPDNLSGKTPAALAGTEAEDVQTANTQFADKQEENMQAAETQPPQDDIYSNWTLAFNTAEGYLENDMALAKGNLMFTEELAQEESEAVFLEQADGAEHAIACFDKNGKLLCVSLETEKEGIEYSTALYPEDVSWSQQCYVHREDPVVSWCNGIEVIAYECPLDTDVLLELSFELEGTAVRISVRTEAANADIAKEELNRLLAGYVLAESVDLSRITPNEIPELKDEELTYAQALEDKEYGAYMLKKIPEGFSEESVRRYKDQHYDYLRGLWTQGMNEISWKVSKFDESARSRMTSAADTVNYDLALYPIPMAESVPEELWEIVNNPVFSIEELTLETVQRRAYQVDDSGDADGYRMNFSVCYGDIVVEVNAKGLEPEDVYEMLKSVL